MGYLKNILIAVDQLGTTIIGGYPDETLSSYAYRMHLHNKPARVFKYLIDFIFGKDHCLESFISEQKRYQSPPELRRF